MRTAMIAITTSNSINVNPRRVCFTGFPDSLDEVARASELTDPCRDFNRSELFQSRHCTEGESGNQNIRISKTEAQGGRATNWTVGVADEKLEREEARLVNRYSVMDGAVPCGKKSGSPYLSMPNPAITFRVLGLVRNSTN
jgi:hypothetical protein